MKFVGDLSELAFGDVDAEELIGAGDEPAPAAPPVAESLARLVNEWLAEGGAAPPARASFPE